MLDNGVMMSDTGWFGGISSKLKVKSSIIRRFVNRYLIDVSAKVDKKSSSSVPFVIRKKDQKVCLKCVLDVDLLGHDLIMMMMVDRMYVNWVLFCSLRRDLFVLGRGHAFSS